MFPSISLVILTLTTLEAAASSESQVPDKRSDNSSKISTESYVDGAGARRVINNSTETGATPSGGNPNPGQQQQPVDNATIPVEEPMEVKTTNDDILISYPSTFGGNVQIALEDPATDTNADHFHPLWFLRPVLKKITNAISFLSHPNTALTPAHIFKKIRDKTLQGLRETYKKLCRIDTNDDFEYKKN